jgi:hypothetical protein
VIDPKYTVDIDTPADWVKYEAVIYSGLDILSPGKARRTMPETVKMIICDFDGVVTDNLVSPMRTARKPSPLRAVTACTSRPCAKKAWR